MAARSKSANDASLTGFTLYDKLQTEFSARLDNGNLFSPLPEHLHLMIGSSLAERREFFGLTPYSPPHDPRVERLARHLRHRGVLARQLEWQARMSLAARAAERDGWYLFLATFTAPTLTAEALWRDGRSWKNFVRSLRRSTEALLGVERDSTRDDAVWYCAVLEHGKSGHHHHVHAVMAFRDVPVAWKRDPNVGLPVPDLTEVRPAQSTWEHGYSTWKPLRTYADRWTRDGWIVPLDLRLRPVESAVVYIFKYLAKEANGWQTRVRATQRLGERQVAEKLEEWSTANLETLLRRPALVMDSMALTRAVFPRKLITRIVRRIIWRRSMATSAGRQSLKAFANRPPVSIWQDMSENVKAGARPWSMSSANFETWLTDLFPPDLVVSYDERHALADYVQDAVWQGAARHAFTVRALGDHV